MACFTKRLNYTKAGAHTCDPNAVSAVATLQRKQAQTVTSVSGVGQEEKPFVWVTARRRVSVATVDVCLRVLSELESLHSGRSAVALALFFPAINEPIP